MASASDKSPPRSFSASEQRERQVWDMIAKERAETDAKTARLRALRLAREAEAPPPPVAKKAAKKKS
jgi:hypothetical protein